MNKESIKKVQKVFRTIAKIAFVITLVAYIALMTYAINDLQTEVNGLYRKLNEIEERSEPNDFYITFCDKYGNTTKQIHYTVDENPSLTW